MDDNKNSRSELSLEERRQLRKEDPEAYATWRAQRVREGRQRQTPEERSEGARKSHTPESDAKRSSSMANKHAEPEYAAEHAARMSEVSSRPDVKTKRSESGKTARQRPEVKVKHDAANVDPEVRAKKAAGSRKRWARPGEHERQSEALRKSWDAPTETRLNSVRHRQSMPLTGLEIMVLAALAERGINLPPENIHMLADRYEFDFYIDHLRLDIECDSRFWHAHPDRVAHDNRRDEKLKAAGYKILRLTEQEITAGDFSRLDAIIKHKASGG